MPTELPARKVRTLPSGMLLVLMLPMLATCRPPSTVQDSSVAGTAEPIKSYNLGDRKQGKMRDGKGRRRKTLSVLFCNITSLSRKAEAFLLDDPSQIVLAVETHLQSW